MPVVRGAADGGTVGGGGRGGAVVEAFSFVLPLPFSPVNHLVCFVNP